MDPFATPEDLAEWLDAAAPDGAERQLARASELVADAVIQAFDVGVSDVAAALRDATCAQVEAWLEVGEENDVDGLAGTQIAVTGFSGKRAPELAPRARRILSTAGLMYAGVTGVTA